MLTWVLILIATIVLAPHFLNRIIDAVKEDENIRSK